MKLFIQLGCSVSLAISVANSRDLKVIFASKSRINFQIWLDHFPTHFLNEPGRVVQSVTCLATDTSLTADPGVASSIPARSHTFLEIDHEIISTVILLPSA